MTPKLANEAFSAKSTQYIRLERRKEPYNTALLTRKRGKWQLEWKQTDGHTVTLSAHARRGLVNSKKVFHCWPPVPSSFVDKLSIKNTGDNNNSYCSVYYNVQIVMSQVMSRMGTYTGVGACLRLYGIADLKVLCHAISADCLLIEAARPHVVLHE
jgi:hypothetical protein